MFKIFLYIKIVINTNNKKNMQITLEEFRKELGQIDFFYEYLDDHMQYQQAANKFHEVRSMAKSNPEFEKLFNQLNPNS